MTDSVFGRLGYESVSPIQISNLNAAPKEKIPLLSAGSANSDQFMLFQLSDGDRPIKDLTEVEPTIAGGDDGPDIQASVAMLAFHLGKDAVADVKANSKATLRLDLGMDDGSNSQMEALFWSI